METIRQQIEGLEELIYELTHLGSNRWYVDVEDVIRINREIRMYVEKLCLVKASNNREEALLCSTLLQAYGLLTFRVDSDEAHMNTLLDRSREVLTNLPVSLLRCRLLVYCYGATYEKDLAREAYLIIDSWKGSKMGVEEKELIKTLRLLDEFPSHI